MELEQYLSGRLLKGSCLDTLKQLPDNSIDSIVTDPPYELGFLGKKWDSSGIAYNIDLWKECLRVLKPGGHLLAFSGSRTYHRMVVAIEDAGFEIRDSIHWTYGTGFPKGQNIAKSVEGKLTTGSSNTKDFKKLKVTLSPSKSGGSASLQKANFKEGIRPSVYVSAGELTLEPTTKEAKDFMGWSTALKPSHEPIVMARKPIEVTVAETVIKYGTGGINIDATRVGGRYTANTILTHNHDCQATGTTTETVTTTNGKGFAGSFGGGENDNGGSQYTSSTPVYSCTPNCPVALLDQQSGTLTPGHWTKTKTTGFGEFGNGKSEYYGTGPKSDAGGASRFFYNSQWQTEDDITPFI